MHIGNFQSITSSQKQALTSFLYVYLWASIRINRLFLLKIEPNDEFFGIAS